jgi:endonuclease/exonuclease/phosphatase family metal-dependent hydrolase
MLTAQMDIVRSNQELILMGDLNGKVGSWRNDEVVGMRGETQVNVNGDRLISLCKQCNLKLSNTFYYHKNIHKFTWERPTLNPKSILDYIIVKQKSLLSIRVSRVKRGANCGSDHYLLVAYIVFKF